MSNTASRPSRECPQPVRGWLLQAVASQASDLHLVAGYTPVLRVHGQLKSIEADVLQPADMLGLIQPLCPPELWQQYLEQRDLDFSMTIEEGETQHRFRVNLFWSSQTAGACLRLIPSRIPDCEWAGFPLQLAERLSSFPDGMVLITGVTGSGKSTTLAMIIDLLNRAGDRRIITIEEPVEYLYERVEGSVVTQREVGVDVQSFADGLKHGLRQDPDVLLVGEIRDQTTAQIALSAAETGHLMLSTLHTRDAKGAISRYTDLFPHNAQSDTRSQLSMSLRAVVSQHLLPSSIPGAKRELALEVLLNTTRVASAIRAGKFNTIDDNIVTGRAEGMITLADSVRQLLEMGRITDDVAATYLNDHHYA